MGWFFLRKNHPIHTIFYKLNRSPGSKGPYSRVVIDHLSWTANIFGTQSDSPSTIGCIIDITNLLAVYVDTNTAPVRHHCNYI